MRAPENPHFMQPVLPGLAKDLLIPVAFFKYLKGRRCGQAFLRSPRGGKLWAVKLRGRRVLAGWKEFVDHLDLYVGDFLVFRHEGDLVFDVMVFDRSTCEKEYDREDVMNTDLREECGEPVEADARNGGLNKNEVIWKIYEDPSASKAKSTVFVGTMRPSYASTLCLPYTFAISNGLGIECSEVIVRDESGKLWPVQLGHRKDDQRVRARWRVFKEAIGLSEGDKFTLKAIEKGRKPVLQFRRLKLNMGKKVILRKCELKICKQIAASIAGQSPAPHLLGIMRLSNLYKNRILIPREFTMTNGAVLANKQGEMIIRYSTGDSWVVMLRNHKLHRLYTGSGWRTLAIQNVLKVGDKYKMELMRETETFHRL